MKRGKHFNRWLLAALLCAGILPAYADRDHDRHESHRHGGEHGEYRYYDTRYHHNRYYPRIGIEVDFVPSGFEVFPYRGDRYYFYGGVWYRPHGPRFVVVTPPIGLAITTLPPYYSTIWVGGVPYYYADGVYYVYRSLQRAYIVTDPPAESKTLTLPQEVNEQFVYPKSGQSEHQQSTDRYECHRWAVSQTGFDPTLPNENLPNVDIPRKRDDYQRATKACLEGRGYSVR